MRRAPSCAPARALRLRIRICQASSSSRQSAPSPPSPATPPHKDGLSARSGSRQFSGGARAAATRQPDRSRASARACERFSEAAVPNSEHLGPLLVVQLRERLPGPGRGVYSHQTGEGSNVSLERQNYGDSRLDRRRPNQHLVDPFCHTCQTLTSVRTTTRILKVRHVFGNG